MRVWDWFWKDKDGNTVAFQPPNWALYSWAICSALTHFVNANPAEKILQYLAFIFLVAWSAMELVRGATPFRKTLGLIILCFTLANQVGLV